MANSRKPHSTSGVELDTEAGLISIPHKKAKAPLGLVDLLIKYGTALWRGPDGRAGYVVKARRESDELILTFLLVLGEV